MVWFSIKQTLFNSGILISSQDATDPSQNDNWNLKSICVINIIPHNKEDLRLKEIIEIAYKKKIKAISYMPQSL